MRVVYGVVVVDGVRRRRPIVLGNRKCERCGNEYEPKHQDSRYCSRECGKAVQYEKDKERALERSRKWYQNNLEKAREKRKAYYWSDPDRFKAKTKEWRLKNLERYKNNNRKKHDRLRHGGMREQIIQEQEGICSVCGKDTFVGYRDACVHHANFDPSDHSEQILVCRKCHAKIHKQ